MTEEASYTERAPKYPEAPTNWSREYLLEKNIPNLPEVRDRGLGADPLRVKICVDWIMEFMEKKEVFSRCRSSYGYKHAVERYSGKYIANRDFIVAAHLCGLSLRSVGKDRINFYVNAVVKEKFRHLFFEADRVRYEEIKKRKELKELRAKWHVEYKAQSLARKKAKQNEAQNR